MNIPTPEELQTLTDTDLDELRHLVAQEQIRRDEITNIPAHVDLMVQRFIDHGGDAEKIKDPKGYSKRPTK